PRPALGDQRERHRAPLDSHRQRRLGPLQPDGDHASGRAANGPAARRGHRRAARAALGAHGGEVGGRPARRVPLAHLHPAGCRTDTRPGPGRCVAGPGLRSRRARAGRRVLLRPPRARSAFQGGVAMLLAIAGFEVRQRLRRVSTYVYFLVFLILAAFFILAAGGAIPGANVDFGTGGKVAINSPWSLASLMTL